MINNIKLNKVPKGYKKTVVGILPADWKLVELSKLAVILFSNVDKHILESEKQVLLCNYKDVYSNRYIFSGIKFSKGSVNENEYKKFSIKKGDVIITKDSEDSRDIAVPSYVLEEIKDLVCGYHLAIIRPQANKLDGMYLAQLLESYNINHAFQRLANGITRFGLNTDAVKKSLIPVPDVNEQKKIAEILLNWDEAVNNCIAIIKVISERNKGLTQELITGQKRIKGYTDKWINVRIGDLLKESKIPSKSKDPSKRISVRLNLKGVEKRLERGNETSNSTSYFIRKQGQFIYGKQNLFKGAIGIIPEELDGYESTQDIPSFDFSEIVIPSWFLFYIGRPTYYSQLENISSGTGSKRIHANNLFKIRLNLPSINEQKAIANVLETANEELKSYEAKLEVLQQQKKGLMQQLLTGKIRVKVN